MSRHSAAEPLESRRLLSATLVKDINTLPVTPYGPPTSPSAVLSIGDVGLFASTGLGNNVELFRTDGTAAGTYALDDLLPGPAGSFPRDFIRAGDVGYFDASTDVSAPAGLPGDELWRSDGTDAGTFRVLGDNPAGAGETAPLAAVGKRLFFLATDPTNGQELWVTDGTAGGAHLVKDLAPGTAGTPFTAARALGDRLLFQTAAQPTVIYSTDGTDAGTVAVVAARLQTNFVPAGNSAYFIDTAGSLWRTDGTSAGTAKALDSAWPNGRFASATGTADGAFFVDVATGNNPSRLYRYHPATGLTAVTRESGLPTGPVSSLMAVGSTVYFVNRATPDGSPPANGLYRVEAGATTATRVPGVLLLGTDSLSQPRFFTPASGGLYFLISGALFRIDSPESGGAAKRVGTFPADTSSTQPLGLTAIDDVVVTTAYSRQLGWAIYKSDGTSAGTGLVADASPLSAGSYPAYLTPFKGKYLFVPIYGDKYPWVTDGTAAGTYRLAYTPSNADVEGFVAAGPHAFFATHVDGFAGTQLWVTDGTPEGTHSVKTFGGQTRGTNIRSLTASPRPGEEGVVYFAASDGSIAESELWRSDGTEAGTYLVKDINTAGPFGTGNSTPDNFVPLPDNTLLFTADDGVHGRELWQTDGTAAGTHLFKNVTPDNVTTFYPPSYLTRLGDFVYFAADDGAHGNELWRTDGTPAGTAMVADLAPGAASSNIAQFAYPGPRFVPFNGAVYFELDLRLWRTDGTAVGTVMVKDVFAPRNQNMSLRVAGDRLYFAVNEAQDPASPGSNLWCTDGTPAGTVPVMPAGTVERIDDLTALGGKLYFRGTRPSSFQTDLYTSDGTAAGTFVVDHIGGDLAGTGPRSQPVALADGSVLVPADDGAVGVELFRFDNPWRPRVVGRHVFYNHSAFDGDDGLPNAADDAAIASDKQALLPGQTASFANVTSYDKGLNGIMIDIMGGLQPTVLAGVAGNIGLKFGRGGDPTTWGNAPRPQQIGIRPGAGANGSDRITLTWPGGAIKNTWLQITVPAFPQYGLNETDVFYFGNLVAESGDGSGAAGWRVNALDLAAVKRSLNAVGTISSATDFNRDGRVNALDLAIVKRALNQFLPPQSAPVPAPAALLADGSPDRRNDELPGSI